MELYGNYFNLSIYFKGNDGIKDSKSIIFLNKPFFNFWQQLKIFKSKVKNDFIVFEMRFSNI